MVKRLLVPAFLLTVILIMSSYGFHKFEGWSFFDGFFIGIMTITTVGAYGDLFPQTETGKMLLMTVALTGCCTLLYTFSIIADLMARHDEHNIALLKKVMLQKPEAPKQ